MENLVLDESQFKGIYHRSSHPEIDQFTLFANSTFRRYKESNQRIDTFRLCLTREWYGCSDLASSWTLKALKLGATRLTFRLDSTGSRIFIPFDEVLRSENVVGLSIETWTIQRGLKMLKCSRLKSLTLTKVSVPCDSFFNIISRCPLIENLSLSNTDRYTYLDENYESQVTRIPDGSVISLPKLTSLVLCRVRELEIQNLFLDDLSSKFPNLKDLTLCLSFVCKGGGEEIYLISSHSLEVLNFTVDECEYYCSEEKMKRRVEYRVEFDVPSIREFTYEGSCIPNMSFRSKSMDQWEESRVSLTRNNELSTLWFCELRAFLTKLGRPKIHLCLHLHYKDSFHYQPGEIEALDMCEVEDLTMDTEGLPSLSFNALLDGLFRICRPKMITQYASPPNTNDIFLCMALGQRMKVKRLFIISQFMLTLLDLGEVNAEKLFDEGWRPQPLDSILDDSKRRFRFRLKWKSS